MVNPNAAQKLNEKILLSELFAYAPTKAQRRQMQIIEAAIDNYATLGLEGTTFESIAKSCDVSRPLIQHYFSSREAIFTLAAKYVRANFQQLAVNAVQSADTPEKKLEAYVRSTFDWIEKYEKHCRVFVLFGSKCVTDKSFRTINTELVDMGHKRIAALLELGNKSGVFNSLDVVADAKKIQLIITAALISAITENRTTEIEFLYRITVSACFAIAGFQSLDVVRVADSDVDGNKLNSLT